MKIGMMADLYKPHISGVTNYISLTKQKLETLGHEVYVFTFGGLDYEDNEPRIIRSPGIPLVIEGYSFNVQYSTRARRLLRTMDIVHVHHPFVSGTLALIYCRQRGIPIVFTNHTRYDLYAKAYIPLLSGVISAATMRGYLPLFCRSVDLVISPSPGMRKVLMDYGVDVEIEVIPNGINLEPFQSVENPLSRNQLGLKDDDVVLIFVGRLAPEKNINLLLEAFSNIQQNCHRAVLLLVGGGPDKEEYEQLVKDLSLQGRVRFCGLISYEEIPRYLHLSDIFVTASVTEVHPLTVIEAMASGLPVVGVHSPGISDTIEHGKTGHLAGSENVEEFSQLMSGLIQDDHLRFQMGFNAQQEANTYSIDRTIQKLIESYQMVLERGRTNWAKTAS